MSQSDRSADEPSWHDNLIYGLSLACADPDAGNWQSRLILDIDHIVEWICGTDGGVRFLVAPATSEFHNVTALKIKVDFSGSGHSQAINELSIDHIAANRPRSQARWHRMTITLGGSRSICRKAARSPSAPAVTLSPSAPSRH